MYTCLDLPIFPSNVKHIHLIVSSCDLQLFLSQLFYHICLPISYFISAGINLSTFIELLFLDTELLFPDTKLFFPDTELQQLLFLDTELLFSDTDLPTNTVLTALMFRLTELFLKNVLCVRSP